MTGLGIRLATSGGRGALAGIVLTALAVATGTAILLFALSFEPALKDRAARAAWHDPMQLSLEHELQGDSGLAMAVLDDRFAGQPLTRVLVGPLDDSAPVPPGLDRLPEPGEAFVSAALAERMAAVPHDELAARIGTVVGTIDGSALQSPRELVAVIGTEAEPLRMEGAFVVRAFPTDPRIPPLEPIAALLVVLAVAGALTPVAVFVATATRLSAARREHRLAALRLVGATPAQTARLAATEAIIPSVAGALGGIALFLATRPLVALIPLGGATWHPESIQPPLVQASALIAAVPVLGVLAALITLRRIVITPLGVQRRQTPPPPRIVRLVPLAVSMAVLLGTLALTETWNPIVLPVLGVAFAGVIGGIAYAGPWLTALVGRGLLRIPAGASTLLAGRRLTDDPRSSFGSIAGVVMAVFVASAFFSFAAYARSQEGGPTEALRPNVVVADVFGQVAPAGLSADVAAVSGVERVLEIRAGEIILEDDPNALMAWVVPCADLLAVLDVPDASCSGATAHSADAALVPGRHGFAPAAAAAGGDRARIALDLAATDIAPITPDGSAPLDLPSVIVDPAALGPGLAGAGVSRLYVVTDGSPAAGERVRSAVVARHAYASVRLATDARARQPEFEEFGRIVGIGLIGTLVLAGCSLAVAVTTGMLERRRAFAMLRSAGMPVGGLRALVLVQAGAPLFAVAAFSAALGVILTQLILGLVTTDEVPWPDASLVLILTGSLLGAMAIVAVMLPSLERLTRPETVRIE